MSQTYDEFINNILETRGRFACGDEYHERHHIIPKCMNGSNDEDNLIDLFAREHFEAHRLLALENPDNDKLIYAWHMMACVNDKNQERVEITAEEYEECRKAYSEMCSKRYSGENNPMYGISPKERMDEETYLQWRKHQDDLFKSNDFREQNRERNIGKKYSDEVNKKKGRSGPAHHMYGKHFSDEVRKKWSEIRKGKPVHTDESKRKISDAMKGEKNPFYGKRHTEETRKKISKANKGRFAKEKNYWYGKHLSEETKEKLRAANTGKKMSDETRKKMSESHKGEKSFAATMVLQCSMQNVPIRIFGCIQQASDELNINKNCIGGCCRGNQKRAGEYKWFYVYDKVMRGGNVVSGAITLGYITEEDIQCLKY